MKTGFSLLLIPLAVALVIGCDATGPASGPAACTSGPANRGTEEWEYLGLGGDAIGTVEAVAVAPDDADLLLAATGANFSAGIPGRLFRSEDRGQTWEQIILGSTSGGGFTEVHFDPHDPDVAYALPFGLIKSTDRGQTWEPADEGVRISITTRVRTLAFDPNEPGVLYLGASGQQGGSLYKSTDEATTWEDLALPECPGPSTAQCRLLDGVISVAVDVSAPQTVYAGNNFSGDVLKTTDGGATWDTTGIIDGTAGGLIVELLVDAVDPSVVYGGVGVGPSMPTVMRSPNGGATWARYDEGFGDPLSLLEIVQEPQSGTLYATAGRSQYGFAVWRRAAGAGAWERMEGPEEPPTGALTLAEEGRVLYVGGEGLWRRMLGEGTATEPGPCLP